MRGGNSVLRWWWWCRGRGGSLQSISRRIPRVSGTDQVSSDRSRDVPESLSRFLPLPPKLCHESWVLRFSWGLVPGSDQYKMLSLFILLYYYTFYIYRGPTHCYFVSVLSYAKSNHCAFWWVDSGSIRCKVEDSAYDPGGGSGTEHRDWPLTTQLSSSICVFTLKCRASRFLLRWSGRVTCEGLTDP